MNHSAHTGKTSDTSNVEVVLEHLPAKCLATEAPFVCAVASFPELQYADIAGEDKERFIAAFVANASDSLDVKPEDVYVTAVRSLADPLNSVAADWWVNASSNNEARVIDQTLIDRRSGVLNGASDEYGTICPEILWHASFLPYLSLDLSFQETNTGNFCAFGRPIVYVRRQARLDTG